MSQEYADVWKEYLIGKCVGVSAEKMKIDCSLQISYFIMSFPKSPEAVKEFSSLDSCYLNRGRLSCRCRMLHGFRHSGAITLLYPQTQAGILNWPLFSSPYGK